MSVMLAIDPGAMSGFALFAGDRLVRAYAHKPNMTILDYGPIDIVVIEFPMIYLHSKARPNDIAKLAAIAGRYQERFKDCEQKLVFPREWKGTIDGDIMTDRITTALTEEERKVVGYGRLDHNMLDAVGIGKWALRQPWMRVRGKSDPGGTP